MTDNGTSVKVSVAGKTPKDIYISLAKLSVRRYLNNDIVKNSEIPEELLKVKFACFVSLHLKKNNELRGCIGTILPTKPNLAQEIITNAISACSDPRFDDVTKKEFSQLKFAVDILSEPEKIKTKRGLNPKKYGLIVRATDDGRLGVLLPDIPGVKTVDDQVDLAMQKAGIYSTDTDIEYFRFTVDRHEEE